MGLWFWSWAGLSLSNTLQGGKPFLSNQCFKSPESSPSFLLVALLCLSSSFDEPPASKVSELEDDTHKLLWGTDRDEESELRFLNWESEETLESGDERIGRETHLGWKQLRIPSITIIPILWKHKDSPAAVLRMLLRSSFPFFSDIFFYWR